MQPCSSRILPATQRGRLTHRQSEWRPVCAAFLLAGALAAAAAVVPGEPAHVQSLNGTWRFKLESADSASRAGSEGDNDTRKDPTLEQAAILPGPATEPFQKPDYHEGPGWKDLHVPGNWEMAGLSP